MFHEFEIGNQFAETIFLDEIIDIRVKGDWCDRQTGDNIVIFI